MERERHINDLRKIASLSKNKKNVTKQNSKTAKTNNQKSKKQ